MGRRWRIDGGGKGGGEGEDGGRELHGTDYNGKRIVSVWVLVLILNHPLLGEQSYYGIQKPRGVGISPADRATLIVYKFVSQNMFSFNPFPTLVRTIVH